MKLFLKSEPRKFLVGANEDIVISDCGSVALEADEQITFTTDCGGEYDVARKEWGYYATPSINGRLPGFGYKTALVLNKFKRYYVMIVEEAKLKEFQDYCKSESMIVVEWLDERGE